MTALLKNISENGDIGHVTLALTVAIMLTAGGFLFRKMLEVLKEERNERRKSQNDLLEVSLKMVESQSEMSTAIKLLTAKLGK